MLSYDLVSTQQNKHLIILGWGTFCLCTYDISRHVMENWELKWLNPCMHANSILDNIVVCGDQFLFLRRTTAFKTHAMFSGFLDPKPNQTLSKSGTCARVAFQFNIELWSNDINTNIGHNTETDTPIPLVIWENYIIQYNYMRRCRVGHVIRWVFVLYKYWEMIKKNTIF